MAGETVIKLPIEVISLADIARLKRAASRLGDYFEQKKLGKTSGTAPASRLLRNFAEDNRIELENADSCQKIAELLEELLALAPTIHISFAAEPSNEFIQKIAGWFRANIHPLTLLTVGLQPSIAAGCYLRTTNRYFDLSLRRHLEERRDLLMKQLVELA